MNLLHQVLFVVYHTTLPLCPYMGGDNFAAQLGVETLRTAVYGGWSRSTNRHFFDDSLLGWLLEWLPLHQPASLSFNGCTGSMIPWNPLKHWPTSLCQRTELERLIAALAVRFRKNWNDWMLNLLIRHLYGDGLSDSFAPCLTWNRTNLPSDGPFAADEYA